MKVGRNDPCPCGSGKKYKKCCLSRTRQVRDQIDRLPDLLQVTIEWLEVHYPDELDRSFQDGYLGAVGGDLRHQVRELSDDLFFLVDRNFIEWLVAEGRLFLDGGEGPSPVLDMVLGESGFDLDAEERRQLEELGRRSLSLYEVKTVVPGSGFRVSDLLAPDAPPAWVHERGASHGAERGHVFGLRLIPLGDDDWISCAFYPVVPYGVTALLERLESELAGVVPGTPAERSVRSRTIVGSWFEELLGSEEPFPPRDGEGGAIQETVFDCYQVSDWERLDTALAACHDVLGDHEHGWSRLGAMGTEHVRLLLHMRHGAGDRLDVFAPSLDLAEAGRLWLAEVAGNAVRLVGRDVVASEGVPGAQRFPAEAAAQEMLNAGSMTREQMQELLDGAYAEWPDRPLSVLDGQTPRQAVETPEGRARVIDLLEGYEKTEAGYAREDGREPASFRFLWEKLGLDRERRRG